MKNKYKLKKDEIIRISDGKVVAKIEEGKVVPTAPAYYKIIEELEAVYDSRERDENIDETDIDAVENENHAVDVKATEEKEEAPETSNSDEAPAMSPLLGDRTPAFMAWLRENNPEEAIKRYGK